MKSLMIEKILNMTNEEKIEYTINKKKIEIIKQLLEIWNNDNETFDENNLHLNN